MGAAGSARPRVGEQPEGGWPQFAHSFPNFLDWRAQQTRFEGLAAFGGVSFATASADSAELVRGLSATADFLPLLRVTPAVGRNFTADEDRPGGNTTVVLLGDGSPAAVLATRVPRSIGRW